MTGGHVQGDLLAPEDVVSLLLDDAQLEQKLREIPSQVGLSIYCSKVKFNFQEINFFLDYFLVQAHSIP